MLTFNVLPGRMYVHMQVVSSLLFLLAQSSDGFAFKIQLVTYKRAFFVGSVPDLCFSPH
jgi:hypothetical protein